MDGAPAVRPARRNVGVEPWVEERECLGRLPEKRKVLDVILLNPTK